MGVAGNRLMCGIWASLGFRPPPSVIDSVAYRGPDGRGWQEFAAPAGPVVLAHRRLAIIDTSDAGLQPMSWKDGSYWITYNGEVYNYLELKAELEARGHKFATHSDTEVILAAYEQWGEDCLSHFIGMFAFVIYDRGTQIIFAARDRFGVKPLYLWRDGTSLSFASEIKQFAALANFSARANPSRCYDFLVGGLFDHTGETMFAGVSQLRGGECVTLDAARWRGETPQPRRWYRLPEPNMLHLRETDAAEQFRALLVQSVRLHLRADVTIGSCLSGGLDSSSIVSLAVDELAGQAATNVFHTISACFEEKAVDERRYIEAVVAKTGVRNSQVFPRPDDFARRIDIIARHQDEPFGSTSIFAQWCVFECAAAAGIKVMLDGQGADEQLAGYHAMFPIYYRQLWRGGHPVDLWRTIAARRQAHGAGLRGELMALGMALAPPPLVSHLVHLVRARQQKRWISKDFAEAAGGALTPVHAALARDGLGRLDGLGNACRAQVEATSLPMLLHYEDRNSMAHGIEARVPFLDHRLVELSIALGDGHKMRAAETKRILRRAMTNALPPVVRDRQDKLGFATPEELWFKSQLRSYVLEGVDEAVRGFPGFFNAAGLRRMSEDMLAGLRPFDFRLWRVVSLGIWGRLFAVAS